MPWRPMGELLDKLAEREEAEAARIHQRTVIDDEPELLECCGRTFANEKNLLLHDVKTHRYPERKARRKVAKA